MALTKIPRGLLDTGIADSSDATAITIDSSENVTFAGNIRFADDKKTIFGTGDDLHIYHTGGHNYIDVSTADQDLIFKGTDGGSDITALTLDMSEAGAATFNNSINSVTNKIVNTNGFFAANLAECDDDRMALLISPTRSTVTDAITLGRMANHSGIQAHDTSDDTAQNFLINPYGGMVGIGTTSPDVNSFGTGHGVLTVASATGSAKTAMLNLMGDGNDTDAARVASVFFNDASASGGGGTLAGVEAYRASNHATDPGADLLFSTNVSGGSYTEKMRIEAGGNVSIGNDDAGSMHSNANKLVVGTGSGDQGMSVFAGTSIGRYAFARAVGNNTDAYDGGLSYDGNRNLSFHTNANATRMTIDGTGHVGIATATEADGTAMTSPLTISGANYGGNIFEAHRTGNSIHRQYMSTGGSSYFDIYGTTPILKFRIAGSDVLDIRASRIDGSHFYSGTDEITSSMNNLKTAGFYRIQNGSLDQPISGNYGAACVFGNQGNVTTQIWSQLQTSNLYVRSFNNAWSSWTAL